MAIYTSITPTGTNYTYSVTAGSGATGAAGASGSVLTTSGAGSGYTWASATIPASSYAAAISANGTLELTGDRADIKLNGESLKETLNEIKEALRIPGTLAQNTELEKEFEELKEAAEHYNKLLKHYKEQKKVFEILKNQDL